MTNPLHFCRVQIAIGSRIIKDATHVGKKAISMGQGDQRYSSIRVPLMLQHQPYKQRLSISTFAHL
jgi:hypothetical protein